ncbi:hypothetical protein CANARDRAFT_30286 [[Candida] arabinofermentans NRRL YB-2248]|uniref:Major facilitator superfamily (MFS) profile domain-containing protein n=1 Tax=[Candida] arabinofermentans NRRL YB-2248 TaxID=983967 RepID=A0A1E4SU96_9ASCO|nr:hypothetical protein CANARDRAFT_30286 [[Candida] arabinofermentans NRRL YB-2248]
MEVDATDQSQQTDEEKGIALSEEAIIRTSSHDEKDLVIEEPSSSSTQSPDFDIPDKFSGAGLLSVIGCFLISVNTWGANSAYSLYLQNYINDDIFPGTSEITYGIIGGLTFGSGLCFGPLVNYSVGTLGLKQTISIGVVVQLAAVLLASFATRIWELYLTQGVLQGVGLALIAIPATNILPQWFSSGKNGKRNLAMGITACGSGVGGVLYNIGLQRLLKNRGYQWSLRVQAILCFVLNAISVFLVKSRSKHIKPVYKFYDKQIWHSFGFWCLISWEMFTLFGYVVLMYNLGDFTRSLGYASEKASIVATMVSVGIIYGRPIVGKLCDLYGPANITMLVSWIVSLLSFAMWIPCRNFATALVFALFVGSMMGTIWVTLASLTIYVTGLRKLGIGLAGSWIFIGLFGFASPIIGMSLKGKNKTGGSDPEQYRNASIFVGFCYFGAGLSLLIMRSWLITKNAMLIDKNDDDNLLTTPVPFKSGLASFLKFKWEKL